MLPPCSSRSEGSAAPEARRRPAISDPRHAPTPGDGDDLCGRGHRRELPPRVSRRPRPWAVTLVPSFPPRQPRRALSQRTRAEHLEATAARGGDGAIASTGGDGVFPGGCWIAIAAPHASSLSRGKFDLLDGAQFRNLGVPGTGRATTASGQVFRADYKYGITPSGGASWQPQFSRRWTITGHAACFSRQAMLPTSRLDTIGRSLVVFRFARGSLSLSRSSWAWHASTVASS